MDDADRLMTTADLARFLVRAESSIEKDRVSGKLGIPFVRLGRMVRYRRADVEAWLSQHVVHNTSQ